MRGTGVFRSCVGRKLSLGGAKEAAEKACFWVKRLKSIPQGLKAPLILLAQLSGLKPRPTSPSLPPGRVFPQHVMPHDSMGLVRCGTQRGSGHAPSKPVYGKYEDARWIHPAIDAEGVSRFRCKGVAQGAVSWPAGLGSAGSNRAILILRARPIFESSQMPQ